MNKLPIVDLEADQRFREMVRAQGRKADGVWLVGYVDHVWANERRLLEAYTGSLAGKQVLEFGCNFGATAIVLSRLGAIVSAVDVKNWILEFAQANACRYGATTISFDLIQTSGRLPFGQNRFDLITCNSVLEYVDPCVLPETLRELDRVLKPGGVLLVMGTSNRLAPREVHSKRLLINYVPRYIDRALGLAQPLQRGIWPWDITRHFPRYCDLALADKGQNIIAAKHASDAAITKIALLRGLRIFASYIGQSVGFFTPSIFLALAKPA